MEMLSSLSPSHLSVRNFYYLITAIATALCLILTVRSSKSRAKKLKQDASSAKRSSCSCPCTCGSNSEAAGVYLNGGTEATAEMLERASVAVAPEWQTGASMMEQLVPEITTHALSYLDYPSLCRLSMTNSLMRQAANDDNAWKALYHKDFTLEQDSVTPVSGWKAYYAATRAIVNINAEFFDILRERSISSMSRYWRNADYIKCIHTSGELFSGYNAVIQSWQLAFFNWDQEVNIQIRDVRARVLTDMAWVTMKVLMDVEDNGGLFNMTNVFEFHNGRWYMVHHHCSVNGEQNVHV